MKAINNILKWFFKIKYDSDFHSKLRSHVIYFYNYYFEPEYSYSNFRLTKCRFYNFPSYVLIELHSLAPGLIIGASGKNIDAFTKFLQKKISKPVKIKIEETNPFK